jgi:hypothetical protein
MDEWDGSLTRPPSAASQASMRLPCVPPFSSRQCGARQAIPRLPQAPMQDCTPAPSKPARRQRTRRRMLQARAHPVVDGPHVARGVVALDHLARGAVGLRAAEVPAHGAARRVGGRVLDHLLAVPGARRGADRRQAGPRLGSVRPHGGARRLLRRVAGCDAGVLRRAGGGEEDAAQRWHGTSRQHAPSRNHAGAPGALLAGLWPPASAPLPAHLRQKLPSSLAVPPRPR